MFSRRLAPLLALAASAVCAACAAAPPTRPTVEPAPAPVAVAEITDAGGPPAPAPSSAEIELDASVPQALAEASSLDATLRASVYATDPTASPASCPKPGLFVEVAKTIETRCPPSNRPNVFVTCKMLVPFAVTNCTSSPVVPSSLKLRTTNLGERVGSMPALEPLLPKQRLVGLVVDMVAGEKWNLQVFAEDPRMPGSFVESRPGVVDVIDRTRADEEARTKAIQARERAACRARGGSYEIVGGFFASAECVFPFPDTGKVCHDKADCRGECLMTRAVPVGNGKVRLDGKCSRLPTTFGCHARIGHVPDRSGIVPEGEIPPTMCVD